MFRDVLFLILVMLLIELGPPIIDPAFGLLLYALVLVVIHFQSKWLKKANLLAHCELLLFLAFVGVPFPLAALFFYFLGLFVAKSYTEIKLLIPFSLPFLLLSLLGDWAILFLGIFLVFSPPLIQWMWQCRPLPESPLKKQLEAFCSKAHFRSAGLRTWKVMEGQLTAAIIGILPKFRYVMFTERLLNELREESIEAVLAHEIGHSKRKHLLLYPFIIAGMAVCLSFFSNYALIFFVAALYFRFVFGFFSRRFERQADLHIFELKPNADSLIKALDTVAIKSGFTHNVPCWHHYSIQERIDFLEKANKNPNLIAQHHFKVKRDFCLYLLLCALALMI